MTVFPLAKLLAQLNLPKDLWATRALALGLAVRCLKNQTTSTNLDALLNRLLPPIFANQYEFYVDQVGRVVGFLTWAITDLEGTKLLMECGSSALANKQWSAGNDLWVLDFAALDGALSEILSTLRDTRFATQQSVTYSRQKKKMCLVKQLTRGDRNSFVLGKNQHILGGQQLTTDFGFLHGHETSLQDALELGSALLGASESVLHLQSRVPRVMHTFCEAHAIRQLRIYQNDMGRPAGTIAWAWLSDETIARMHTTSLHEIHTSEWNEGKHLCFFDVALSKSAKSLASADIMGRLFPEEVTALLYTPPDKISRGNFIRVARAQERSVVNSWLDSLFQRDTSFVSCQ
jgi:hemolysin-activating ACP:hemolysin acyltransferase